MSKICTLYVTNVEKEAEQSSLLFEIMVQITTPTATKIRCSMLCKKSGLYLLIITANAFGRSAMNPIEYIWSPFSSSLTPVQLRSSNKEDGTPPCMDRSLSKEQQKTPNKEILEESKLFFTK